MSPFDLAFVGCRLLATLAVLKAVWAVPNIATTFAIILHTYRGEEPSVATTLLPQLVLVSVTLLTGIILWRHAESVAKKMLPRDGGESGTEGLAPSAQAVLMVSGIALWVFLDGLPRLVSQLVRTYQHLMADSVQAAAWHQASSAEALGALIQAGLGAALLLRAQGFVGLLRKIRLLGLPRTGAG